MPSTDQSAGSTTSKWLSVIGIGEDGIAGLGEQAKTHIAAARIVFGGKRHLDLARPLIKGDARQWPAPFDSAMKAVLAHHGSPVCVLASGDPFMHGVGATLARHVSPAEMCVIPHASAFSLAAARLGWALQDIDTVSLHGRELGYIRPLLHPGRRIIALTSDENGPRQLAGLMAGSGFGGSRFIVLEALGGEHEKAHHSTATAFDLPAVNPLNIVAIEVKAGPDAAIIPLAPGISDDMFDHDGQITKREIRALTLSALAPRRGERLWDIGAGSGSVSIEWMLRHPSMQAIAIEQDSKRADRIKINAARFGVPSLNVVEGKAPQALEGLPAPDAIFIGGGGSKDGIIDAAIAGLRNGGRLVANAITLEMEAVLLDCHVRLGGELTKFSVSRAEPVGSMSGWRPAMPVTQWRWTKP